jgi:hypothetical protein
MNPKKFIGFRRKRIRLKNAREYDMKAHKVVAVLTAVVAAAVLVSGCSSFLPLSSTSTPKPRDLSASYDAAFSQGGWRAVERFTQVTPNVYSGTYTDVHGYTWNFTVELMSSANDAYGRYFQLMKERTDDGYVRANESKINVGTGQTVFGRVDEKWYGYKVSNTTNPALAALFYGYDGTNGSWVVATASSDGITTTQTSTASAQLGATQQSA